MCRMEGNTVCAHIASDVAVSWSYPLTAYCCEDGHAMIVTITVYTIHNLYLYTAPFRRPITTTPPCYQVTPCSSEMTCQEELYRLTLTKDKDQQESRAVAEKLRDDVVKFDT